MLYYVVSIYSCSSYLNTGGLSKKPGQVCDSRVKRTIHHQNRSLADTHSHKHQERGASTKKPREDEGLFVCLTLWLFFNAIFFSTVVYLTVFHCFLRNHGRHHHTVREVILSVVAGVGLT